MKNKMNALVAGAKCKAMEVMNRKDAGIETIMVIAPGMCSGSIPDRNVSYRGGDSDRQYL